MASAMGVKNQVERVVELVHTCCVAETIDCKRNTVIIITPMGRGHGYSDSVTRFPWTHARPPAYVSVTPGLGG